MKSSSLSGLPLSILPILLLLMGGAIAGPALTAEAINQAEMPKATKGIQPGIVKAEILLDRLHFSPGVIDGTGPSGALRSIRWLYSIQNSQPKIAAKHTRLDVESCFSIEIIASKPRGCKPEDLKIDETTSPVLRAMPANVLGSLGRFISYSEASEWIMLESAAYFVLRELA
jgi:hypothetical protein